LKKIAFLILSFILGLASFTPAVAHPLEQANTVRVEVDNRTGSEVDVRFAGQTSITVTVGPGKTKVDLPVGNYTYSYKACHGKSFTGDFRARQNGDKLTLVKCGGSNGGVGVTGNPFILFQNKTNESVTIRLSGPKSYSVAVAGRSNIKLEVAEGTYSYSYSACGLTKTGTIKTKTAPVQLEIAKCQGDGPGAGAGGAGAGGNSVKTIVLVINNRTDATLNFTFVGPQTYRVQALVGKTRVTMEKGRYTWTMSSNACGGYGTDSGQFTLKQSSNWTWTCN
jgi:hypothetical protein